MYFQFVQKKDPAYKDNKEDTAWTMDKLNEYVNETIAKDRSIEKDWVFGSLTVRNCPGALNKFLSLPGIVGVAFFHMI